MPENSSGPEPGPRVPGAYRNGELVIVIDCADLARAARFWSAVLGYRPEPASGRYQSLIPAGGSGVEILLQRVDDPKHGKNRVHLDLRTPDLAAEASRIRHCGATQITTQPVTEDGWRWHILADPDGNEFCVLQPPRLRPSGPPGARLMTGDLLSKCAVVGVQDQIFLVPAIDSGLRDA